MKARRTTSGPASPKKNKLDLGYRVARIYRDARRVRDGNL
jgi:hypothetical protein